MLLTIEGLGITLLGVLFGIALLAALAAAFGSLVALRWGLMIDPKFISLNELPLVGAVVWVGLLASLIPGYRAYRLSLADGLTPRI